MNSRQPLQPIRALGQAIVVLLALQAVTIGLEIAARLYRIDLWRQLESGAAVSALRTDRADRFVGGAAAIGGLTFVATVLLWLIWQHRAQRNAIDLAGGGLRFTPGWAVGWWFIPFANLVKPFQTARELWKASHGPGWQTLRTWRLLGWWWALWLAGWLTTWFGPNGGQVGFGTAPANGATDLPGLIARDRWGVFWLGARILAAVLAIMIVRSVGRLQARAAAARDVATMPGPPALATAADPTPLPPPPAAPVRDALGTGERIVILVSAVAVFMLTVGGSVRPGPVEASEARPIPSIPATTPIPSIPSTTPIPSSTLSPSGTPTPTGSGFTLSYDGHGVHVSYPANWAQAQLETNRQLGFGPVWAEGFTPLDLESHEPFIASVWISGYTLHHDTSHVPAEQLRSRIIEYARQLSSQNAGVVISEVSPTSIGPLRGYRFSVDETIDGTPVTTEITFLFDGKSEYTIKCQTNDETLADVTPGCGMIRTTFRVTDPG